VENMLSVKQQLRRAKIVPTEFW